MAHSFVTSFEHESDSFRAFARSFPDDTVLLIDTYDTVEGAHKAVEVGKEMEACGKRLIGVRLDSGDILHLSKEVRHILDAAGLEYVKIVASGGLDEYQVDYLVQNGAPIDSFGVGTKMAVSGDAPWLDMAYKLVRYQGRPVRKLSTGKASLPDEKQVFRYYAGDGSLIKDVIGLRSESTNNTGTEVLLHKVMAGGKILNHMPELQEFRERFREEFNLLPLNYKSLNNPEHYPVELSQRLSGLRDQIQHTVEKKRRYLDRLGISYVQRIQSRRKNRLGHWRWEGVRESHVTGDGRGRSRRCGGRSYNQRGGGNRRSHPKAGQTLLGINSRCNRFCSGRRDGL